MRTLPLAAVAVALVLFPGEREALAQPAGFAQSSVLGVNNGAVSSLTDYQVRLVINTQALIAGGQMRPDANDLVFTLAQCGGGMQPVLGHWIESGVNTASTVVWVKVPLLPSGVTRLNMYYSNPSAAATSSPRSVFIGTGVANDPISSTNQVIVTATNTVNNNQRGFRFTTNVPALVVEFGKRVPNSTDRIVTLFDFNSQTLIRQTTVIGAAASYVYNPTAPFWLTQGTQYILEIFGATGDSYYYGTSSQISPDFTYGDQRYCNDCTASTFPTQVLTNYHYGNPDLRYYKRLTSTPEPNQVSVTGGCNECGDGFINPAVGEQCDDGNFVTTDACPACLNARCGDGYIRAGVEVCDDGNTVTTDACPACQNARCGDGYVRAGSEQCDDGNTIDTDGCRNTCTSALCGDGVIQTGVEQCDDGNAVETDACRNGCVSARCGDGVVRAGVEQCDDGNSVNTDACRNDCTLNMTGTGGTGMGGAGMGGAGMGGAGRGGAGSGGTSTGGVSTGGAGTGGVSTGGTSTGGVSTGGRSTGGVSTGGTAGEGGVGQAGEGGDDSPGTGGTGLGGDITGGRGGSVTGGRTGTGGKPSRGGTAGTKPDLGGEGGDYDDGSDDETTVTEGCGCRVAGSRSSEVSALSFALLGLVLGVRARRRRTSRPS